MRAPSTRFDKTSSIKGVAVPAIAVLLLGLVAACSSSSKSPSATAANASGGAVAATSPATTASVATPTLVPSTAASGATGGSASGASGAASLAGSWKGTWTRTSPLAGNGNITLDLQQQGQALSGKITLTGSACLTDGASITGTLNGQAMTLSVDQGGAKATFTGQVSASSISGNMQVTCSGVTGNGTWTASK